MQCPKCKEDIRYAEITKVNKEVKSAITMRTDDVLQQYLEHHIESLASRGFEEKGQTSFSKQYDDEEYTYGYYWSSKEHGSDYSIENKWSHE